MKTFALPLLALFAPVALNAAVYTVSNEVAYPAQFDNVQTAHDAAVAGDTLLVKASASDYGQLILDRQLTVIGEGHEQIGAHTRINAIICGAGSSGSNFLGFAGNFYLDAAEMQESILIERCRGTVYGYWQGFGLNGLIVKHSVIQSIYLYNCTQVLITNNIIRGQISGSTSPSVSILNNVFTNDGSYVFTSVQYALVANNIFYGSAPSYDGAGVENCAFNNNISFGTTDDDLPPTGSNVGAGNQVGVDPQFVNVPDNQGLTSYDYHLQAGSPGIAAGTDGTDIGLYGGSAPLNVPLDGKPRLPEVTAFNLLSSSIGEGGSINVQVQGAKHD
jgi:hypothetical protein